MFKSILTILTAVAALNTVPALAHPHVFVSGKASFQIEDAKLARVSMRWQFDAFFSQVLGTDFDTNADGMFDAEETQAMKDQVFTSLKDFGYFTHLRTDTSDTEKLFSQVDKFVVTIEGGELVFAFELILAEPIDPKIEEVGLSLYDPTIYVDLILGGDEPVKLAGAEGMGCAVEFRQGDEISSQSYFMTPQEVWLTCNNN